MLCPTLYKDCDDDDGYQGTLPLKGDNQYARKEAKIAGIYECVVVNIHLFFLCLIKEPSIQIQIPQI